MIISSIADWPWEVSILEVIFEVILHLIRNLSALTVQEL